MARATDEPAPLSSYIRPPGAGGAGGATAASSARSATPPGQDGNEGQAADYKDHTARTAAQPRRKDVYSCIVTSARPLTETVLGLRFKCVAVNADAPGSGGGGSSSASGGTAATGAVGDRVANSMGLAGPDTTAHDGLPRFRFKAGQWVDLYVPPPTLDGGAAGEALPAGGFTLTSSPKTAFDRGEFELAVAKADRNPVAAWLWRDASRYVVLDLPATDAASSRSSTRTTSNAGSIDEARTPHFNGEPVPRGKLFKVVVGGQFHFPPLNFRRLGGKVRSLALVAAGVGVNPMRSILKALNDLEPPSPAPSSATTAGSVRQRGGLFPGGVSLHYGVRNVKDALFLDDLTALFRARHAQGWRLHLYVSRDADGQLPLPASAPASESSDGTNPNGNVLVERRRLEEGDLATLAQTANAKAAADSGVGPSAGENVDGRSERLFYICGPAKMTDWVQETLLKQGVDRDLVQTERWW